MKLIFHAGAHFTEENRLVESLERNGDAWAARGVYVPDVEGYKKPLRQRLLAPADADNIADLDKALMDALPPADTADRVILSYASIFSAPKAALRKGKLYPKAPQRVADLARIFHDHDIHLHMALRNPATFIPCCFRESPRKNMKGYLADIDLRLIRWSETLCAMRAAAPQVPITVWCNEDALFLWPRILRNMGGLAETEEIEGGFDLLTSTLSEEGVHGLSTHLKMTPAMDDAQMQETIETFLPLFARPEAVSEEIDLPEWTPDLVEMMSADYEHDVRRISEIPGVTVMTPRRCVPLMLHNPLRPEQLSRSAGG